MANMDSIQLQPTADLSFNQGIAVACQLVQLVYNNLNRDIFVEINNAGINVGNTQFLRALTGELNKIGIPVCRLNTLASVDYEEMKKLESLAERETQKRVYITETSINKYYYSTSGYRDIVRVSSIAADLYIGLYTPAKPFRRGIRDVPVADIMVCNETLAESQPA